MQVKPQSPVHGSPRSRAKRGLSPGALTAARRVPSPGLDWSVLTDNRDSFILPVLAAYRRVGTAIRTRERCGEPKKIASRLYGDLKTSADDLPAKPQGREGGASGRRTIASRNSSAAGRHCPSSPVSPTGRRAFGERATALIRRGRPQFLAPLVPMPPPLGRVGTVRRGLFFRAARVAGGRR